MRECNALEARFGQTGMFTFLLKKRGKNPLCYKIFFAKSVTLVPIHTPCGFLNSIGCFGYLRRADIPLLFQLFSQNRHG